MKKTYTKPTIEVTLVNMDNVMNQISGMKSNEETIQPGGDDNTGNHDIDAKEHYNSWGLWEDDDYEDFQ